MNHSIVQTGRAQAPRARLLPAPRFAVIIPACNEEACIGLVLDELLEVLDPADFVVAVGVNGSSDATAEVARARSAHVTETPRRGYGFGCQAAIDELAETVPTIRGYIFFAGDGASDPSDLPRLVAAYEAGSELVLGTRTANAANWRSMTFRHVLANFALGCWCGLLTGRFFTDLGPLRLIDRALFERMDLCEMTFGWTIEAQVAAVRLGAKSQEVRVQERRRLAGEQKVSGVTWRRTLFIGCKIVAAGWRTRWRYAHVSGKGRAVESVPVPQPQEGLLR